jgi:hypothetical protein
MRRAITEWGLVLSGVLSVAFGVVWADSFWLRTLQEPLSIGSACFLRVENGRVCFYSELGNDWKPTFGDRDRPALTWVRSYTNWFLPGLEYHHRLLANGRSIWSLEVAFVIPVAVLLTTMAIFWRAMRGSWRIRGSVSP